MRLVPRVTKRRWGYAVWGVGLAFVFVPELLAAWQTTERHLPFTTISAMVGHLEYVNPLWEIAPTAFVVLSLYSLLRVPPRETSGGHTAATVAAREKPHRTAGGRLTFAASADAGKGTDAFDDELAGGRFAAVALVVAGLLAFLTVWARDHWHERDHFHAGYVLYGGIGLFWFLVPSLIAVSGRDAPFPTLYRTVGNVEQVLARHRGNWFGKAFAWLFPYVLVWGLVFMMIHLTLYPFPDITHVLNPNGR